MTDKHVRYREPAIMLYSRTHMEINRTTPCMAPRTTKLNTQRKQNDILFYFL